jgi:signal transduction histidine kinase
MQNIVFFFLLVPLIIFGQTKDAISQEMEKKIIEYGDVVYLKKTYDYYSNQEWDSTLVYSYKLLNTTTNKELLDYTHYFRAHSFKKKGLLAESLKEYQLITTDFPFYLYVKSVLGELFLEQNEYQNALQLFIELEKDYDAISYKLTKSALFHNIGLCYFHLSKYDKAETYLSKSTLLQEKQYDTLLLISSYMDMGNLYYEQYKDKQAIPYFEKAYLLSKKAGNFALKQNAALNMSIVEENRKDLTKAMVYRKEYDVWKDSLNNQNKIWAVAEIEKKYVINEKQKEIQLLAFENKAKVAERNTFIASSILLLLLFGTAIYFYTQKNKTNKIILSQKKVLNTLNATKDKLFSIVSHDLRSSVNTMQRANTKLLKDISNRDYGTLDKTVHKNAAIVNSTFNLLENLLHWSTLQTEQLYFHIESVDLFSVIQQVAHNYKPLFENKELVFSNKIPRATFILADLDSLKIVTRNVLDNAIKFSDENDTISVYTYDKNDPFQYFVIEDTGIGMNDETRMNLLTDGVLLNKKKNQRGIGTGLGLQLCKSMIQKNKGKLTIESTEGKGTKIIIALPKFAQNG